MIPQAQIEQARQADLLRLVETDTSLRRIAGTHGGEYAGPCPFCGGEDRFHVVPAAGRWYCRQCTPRGGDGIDYLRKRDRLTFQEAIDRLLDRPYISLHTHATTRTTGRAPAWRDPAWQEAARAEVQQAVWRLNNDMAAERGRSYLRDRGLFPATWQAWNLGYAWAWHPNLKAMAPAIVMPWQAAGYVQAVQYRFIVPGLAKQDRFSQRKGGERTLFGLDMRQGRAALFLVEGELNALSLWQLVRARADVLSCGSQEGLLNGRAQRLAQAIAQEYLRVYVWLDDPIWAVQAAQLIAPGAVPLWSEDGLDANDRLQNGTLIGWLEKCP